MDQVQNADLKVAQLISRLTKEVTDLRGENAQLRVRPDLFLSNFVSHAA